jgi:hypothetical protein
MRFALRTETLLLSAQTVVFDAKDASVLSTIPF